MHKLTSLLPGLAALLLGASASLAFAPFSLPLFAILSVAGFWLTLRGNTPRQAARRGWLYGLGFFGAGTSWIYVSIHTYGNASVLLAGGLTFLFCAALALLFAIQAWMGARWFRGKGAWIGFIALWWLFEWLRSWFLTGFPWLYLGYAWTDSPLKSLAPVTGVWGLTFLTLLMGAGAVESFLQRRIRPILPATLLVALTLLLPTQWTIESGEPIKTAVMQPNVPQLEKWNPQRRDEILDQLIEMTRAHPEAELVVWPENAIPAFYYQVADRLQPLLTELGSRTLLAGLPTSEPDPNDSQRRLYHNSVAALGNTPGVYHKQRLVPFGEYVPMESLLRGLIEFFNLPMSSFSLPRQQQGTLQAGPYELGVAVCYEIAYPELVRESALQSDILLTVSNDTWFGRSIGPDQHLQMARMRALENGRWVMRGTNNGITALIDPQGQISAELPVDKADVLTGEVRPMQGRTPYQLAGVYPLLMLNLLLLAGLLFRHIRTPQENH
ncbi:apolipoprotein N-acyltransferase [Marinobacterium lutimaris]|uniref:Apolipoprotein N-acyltransferase n=1 Tax=Marinobacterium lutimaris TaxID=568106 RepID=A0A1H6BKX0_9GAMM|nr:apolipoprotein N-acyltransferase [Marinobacterium lutimaris]SEG61358.1 Apolipoprotein N-acyltransferase [Marinobacterium lutimaris]